MNFINFIILLAIITIFYNMIVKKIAKKNAKSIDSFTTNPKYFGLCLIVWNLIILSSIFVITKLLVINFSNISYLSCFIISIITFIFINNRFKARQHLEKLNFLLMLTCTLFTIIITIFIVATIFIETLQFFQTIPLISFVFGSNWDPQNEIPEYVTSSFGVIPLFAGTFLITIIAILTSAPIGILSSIYLTEYSTKKFRLFIKPLLEVLAGIPTVVYGYFAAIIVAPTIREIGIYFSLDISSESALAAGIVMGIMIVPYILSLSDDVINAVPQTIRDASLALGATKAETTIRIVLPAAKHGIYGSLLLAISRAIGETMIVTMAAGLRANMSFNPLESTTTVTAQIVSLLSGDQEFHDTKTLAAFALAMVLFILTFILNIFAQIIVGNNKNKYE